MIVTRVSGQVTTRRPRINKGSSMENRDDLGWVSSLSLPRPFYRTRYGAAYLGDALALMRRMPSDSIDLVLTSPPYALRRKKAYGNVDAEAYVEWFVPFAREFLRLTKTRGSVVVHIGGSWNKGEPTRSVYHYELLLRLIREGFKLCQEFFWFNSARLPTPAEWVTVKRIRVKDAVEHIWWLSKSTRPKADNTKVLKRYSESMVQLLLNGYKPGLRPSGHNISSKFNKNRGGAIPPNIFVLANTESNSQYLRFCHKAGIRPHPARFPAKLPKFFTEFLTKKGDILLDPFGGSNVTGEVAESLERRWLCFERVKEYLDGSRFRF